MGSLGHFPESAKIYLDFNACLKAGGRPDLCSTTTRLTFSGFACPLLWFLEAKTYYPILQFVHANSLNRGGEHGNHVNMILVRMLNMPISIWLKRCAAFRSCSHGCRCSASCHHTVRCYVADITCGHLMTAQICVATPWQPMSSSSRRLLVKQCVNRMWLSRRRITSPSRCVQNSPVSRSSFFPPKNHIWLPPPVQNKTLVLQHMTQNEHVKLFILQLAGFSRCSYFALEMKDLLVRYSFFSSYRSHQGSL